MDEVSRQTLFRHPSLGDSSAVLSETAYPQKPFETKCDINAALYSVILISKEFTTSKRSQNANHTHHQRIVPQPGTTNIETVVRSGLKDSRWRRFSLALERSTRRGIHQGGQPETRGVEFRQESRLDLHDKRRVSI